MIVTRRGLHYPKPDWQFWRDSTVTDMVSQWQITKMAYVSRKPIFTEPVSMGVKYWAIDNRRRDVSGMLDALFHCLERAFVVKDDSLIVDVHWLFMGVDPKNPAVEICIQRHV